MTAQLRLILIDDYAPFVGAETIERIREKARPLQDATSSI
jgi:hypothetical protein